MTRGAPPGAKGDQPGNRRNRLGSPCPSNALSAGELATATQFLRATTRPSETRTSTPAAKWSTHVARAHAARSAERSIELDGATARVVDRPNARASPWAPVRALEVFARVRARKKIRNWWREMLTPADVVCACFLLLVRLTHPPTGATHTRRACRDRPIPLAPRLAPRSTPPGCSPSSTAEPHARRGSSPSDSAVPAPQVRFSRKTRNNRVVSIPSFARPRAPRRDASRCEARVGVVTRLLTRSPSFARVRAKRTTRADATRDDRHRLASDADAGVIADLGNARDGNSRMFSKFSFPLPGTEGRGPSRFHGETEN